MYKYVVFGAGNYGDLALRFYGEDKVKYFVDNNERKIGSLYFGKRIISFDDYMNNNDRLTIVVAVNNSDVILKQLKERHIQDFFLFKPEFFKIQNFFVSNYNISSIVLYGIDDSTKGIVDILERLGMKKRINYIVKTRYDKYSVNNDIKHTSDLSEDIADCYVISKYKYHMALTALLEKRVNKELIYNPYYKREFYDTDTVVINPYEEKEEFKSEQAWNDDIKAKDLLREETREYVECSQGGSQLFEFIEIETINRCNGVCSFCPVNKKNDARKEVLMSEELYEKIINELSFLNYNGHLCLFSNNEPLLDSRLVEFCVIARSKLPNAYIYLYTNGTLLSLDLFNKLICNLDELVIDNYSLQHSLIKPVKEIVESIQNDYELRKKVTVVIRDPKEILTSRGGEAPNRENVVSFNNDTCALPFRQMVVRPDGKVSLCCNDPLGRETMGDLNEQNITDVWFGEKYTKTRELITKGRGYIAKCTKCDTFYLF